MAGEKEIRSKIHSIKNTQKITRAMEMVAASKMRKAQERMRTSRPYSEKIFNVIRHLARGHSEYRHPFLIKRPVKRVGLIVVSTDRGLCGGLNTNLFRKTLLQLQKWQEDECEVDVCLIGKKAEGFFNRLGVNVVGLTSQLGDAPNIKDLIGLVRVMLDGFYEGRVDEVHIVFNKFINTMTQDITQEKLLPLEPATDDEKTLSHHWDYIYEPEAKVLLDQLLQRYVESGVYQAVIENLACEQAARMVAMKSASDNAGNMIDEFQLAYNKARQAAITQEISEIVSGASAV